MSQPHCLCLGPKRRAFIDACLDFAADLPDGAFMAYMEQEGIDVSELEVYSASHVCNQKQKENKLA